MKSIRNTLLGALTTASLLTSILVGLWSYAETTHEVEELFDAELAQMTRVLQGLLGDHTDSASLAQLQARLQQFEELAMQQPPLPQVEYNDEFYDQLPGHRYETKIAFQVWRHQGEELVTAHPGLLPLPQQAVEGFAWVQAADYGWRTFTLYDERNGFWLRAAQREDVRRELTDELGQSMLWPWLWMIPLLLAALFMIITWGFRPLKQIEREVQALQPEQLEPIALQRAPQEIQGLVGSLNQLLVRLRENLAREQRFTADAAHELRTPLAILKLNLQTAMNQPRPELAPLLAGIERMTHLVEQLLMLSRLDPRRQLETPQWLDLRPLAETLMAELAPLALARDVEPILHAHTPCPILGESALIQVLLSNLVQNAILYSPPQTQVDVYLEATAHGILLRVEDQGPGIPVEERERVLIRFVRGEHASGTGSGLGLSIAQRIADLHGARLTLTDRRDGGTGLSAQVLFPPVVA